ncbi:putative nitric oxide reductase (Nor) complex membrane protein [Flavobacterium enshiense DK69]|uniref:Nitric oxide reductase n=1 Tax=Flavobacterium enshiense DK69 TaxID=1107311 RepID=V6S9Q6_9FLAO|nr:cytochrome c oxidase subunit 3 [Flavobacterium enshiense]ESU23386.1 putative nitric oxide reductase (Nor) complex membrane protein [Flavobacterium enshiense DK69]KGO96386.1 nitric oxide reductase [Flavobacterium enshiense DK69]
MKTAEINHSNFYYPPGGILMWIIIFLELITFGMALVAFVFYGKEQPEVFHDSRMQLNTALGTLNTVFLLTSGYFMAQAVQKFKNNNLAKASLFFKLSFLGGLLFLIVKGFEYYHKIEMGISIETNLFYSFYWLVTGFHLIHVIVGLVILMLTHYGMMKKNSDTSVEDVEACAAFWHMCDLIWLLVFPTLYLLF